MDGIPRKRARAGWLTAGLVAAYGGLLAFENGCRWRDSAERMRAEACRRDDSRLAVLAFEEAQAETRGPHVELAQRGRERRPQP